MTGWRSADLSDEEQLPGAPHEGAWLVGLILLTIMWIVTIGLIVAGVLLA